MNDVANIVESDPGPVRYYPFFVGKTKDNEKIVLYHRLGETIIRKPDGELWALEPGARVETFEDKSTCIRHISIHSKVWTGAASGNKVDLIEEPAI